jgi:hypothetical protein
LLVVHSTNDIEFQKTYSLDPAVLNAVLADGIAQVVATYASDVNGDDPSFAQITLTYTAVPEPSALAMLLAALPLGYLAYRRR